LRARLRRRSHSAGHASENAAKNKENRAARLAVTVFWKAIGATLL